MNVAIVGASGRVGTRLLAELLRRGDTVTGIARHLDALEVQPGFTAKTGDADDAAALGPVLHGHDAAISAVRFASLDSRQRFTAGY